MLNREQVGHIASHVDIQQQASRAVMDQREARVAEHARRIDCDIYYLQNNGVVEAFSQLAKAIQETDPTAQSLLITPKAEQLDKQAAVVLRWDFKTHTGKDGRKKVMFNEVRAEARVRTDMNINAVLLMGQNHQLVMHKETFAEVLGKTVANPRRKIGDMTPKMQARQTTERIKKEVRGLTQKVGVIWHRAA